MYNSNKQTRRLGLVLAGISFAAAAISVGPAAAQFYVPGNGVVQVEQPAPAYATPYETIGAGVAEVLEPAFAQFYFVEAIGGVQVEKPAPNIADTTPYDFLNQGVAVAPRPAMVVGN